MDEVLSIENLCKEYPKFHLDNVSFCIKKGTIMGFIGRNGAGKSTTLKSILNIVHPKSGTIKLFGLDLCSHEGEIKQRIGFAGGAVGYYKKKKIIDIVNVTKMFYDNWDDGAYKRFMTMFAIDEEKTPEMLSEGMKVKFSLVLALSHQSELLILDEPTSGLDPVSRDELLDVFLQLAQEGKSILFSTHITSDLDKCADYITYIKNGKIVASQQTDDFINAYKTVCRNCEFTDEQQLAVIGERISRKGNMCLIKAEDTALFDGCSITAPTLEEIMIHFEKSNNHE